MRALCKKNLLHEVFAFYLAKDDEVLLSHQKRGQSRLSGTPSVRKVHSDPGLFLPGFVFCIVPVLYGPSAKLFLVAETPQVKKDRISDCARTTGCSTKHGLGHP